MQEFHENVRAAEKTNLKIDLGALPVGKSYKIVCVDVNEGSLRALVSAFNSKHKNKIICKKHKKLGFFEIANIGEGDRLVAHVHYEQVKSSPQALAKHNIGGKRIYPFADLTEGKSFIVPIADTKEKSLRTLCYVQGRKYGKKFVVIKHEQSGIYEVACLRKTKVVFYENSPQALAKGVE